MRHVVAVLLLSGLAGCVTQPCDPGRDTSILQVGGCVMGGGYRDRLNVVQRRLTAVETERDAAQAAYVSAQGRNDRAATEQARLGLQLAEQRRRSVVLERDMTAARERTRVDQQRLAALEADMAQSRAEQDRLRTNAPSGSLRQEDVRRLQQREGVLRARWDVLRQSAQRE